MAKKTRPAQHSSCPKGTSLLRVSLTYLSIDNIIWVLSLPAVIPVIISAPLPDQGWVAPRAITCCVTELPQSLLLTPVPKVVAFPVRVLVSSGLLARQGQQGAVAEEVDPEESSLFTSTAHRTTCFLPFTFVYLISNPRISSMINIPARTPIQFIFFSNPSYFSREESCNKLNQTYHRTRFSTFSQANRVGFLDCHLTICLFREEFKKSCS